MTKPAIVEGFTKSLAVLVAIDDYRHGVPVLQTPVADAKRLAQLLHDEHGFEVEIVANENATFDKLKALLSGLAGRVGANDRVLFYFAGHGTALPSEDGPRGYILPQDADRDSNRCYLPMDDLNRALSALPCRHMLAILDCCFAGALRWASTRDLIVAPGDLHRERYDWFIRDAAWQAIASAAHDQRALDVAAGQPLGARGQEMEHSPFAQALIDGLTGLADMRSADQASDGVITATELFIYLRDRLTPPPGTGRLRQTPVLWPLPKHDKGEFVFLVPGRDLELPPAPPLDFKANPWVGLETYDSTQSSLFFGRRRVSEALVQRVLRDSLVVVTGPSGIGKSSLVRAGLLPRLRDLPIVPIIVRPGPNPFAALATALRSVEPAAVEPPGKEVLRTDPMSLANWIAAQGNDGQFVLVIDQAEELITQNRDVNVQEKFLALIANALERAQTSPAEMRHFGEVDARTAIRAMGYGKIAGLKQDGHGIWSGMAEKDDKTLELQFDLRCIALRVVLTVRSEFEPQFAQSPLRDRWIAARSLIPRMTQDELRRVIESPASVKVIRFESSALVDQLVNEVVEMPGALPVLSFALSEMYKNYIRRQANDRTLSFVDYEALKGGVTGSLRARANEVVDGVDEQHKITARRVLERFVSVDAGAFARRRVPKRELDAADQKETSRVKEIVDRLESERLIVSDQVGDEPYAELAHDALILGWDRLLGWIREDAALIAPLRLLTPNAEEWASSPEEKSGLLWSDAGRLSTIKQLASRASPGLNRVETDFAKASNRRARRNWLIGRLIAAILIVLTVGAVAAAIYASNQTRLASREARASTARLLASEAANAGKDYPARGLLLAVAAASATMKAGDPISPDAESALRSLLEVNGGEGLPGTAGLKLITFAPEKNFLIGLRDTQTLARINMSEPYSDQTFKVQGSEPITSIALDASQQRVALARGNGSIQLVDLHPEGFEVKATLPGVSKRGVEGLQWSSDGKWIGGFEIGRLVLIRLSDQKAFSFPVNFLGPVLSFSPDGSYVAGHNKFAPGAVLVSLAAPQPILALGGSLIEGATAVGFVDDHTLVAGFSNGQLRYLKLDADRSSILKDDKAGSGAIKSFAYSARSSLLAIVTSSTVFLKSNDGGEAEDLLRGSPEFYGITPTTTIASPKFSQDGEWLATYIGKRVFLWPIFARSVNDKVPLILGGHEANIDGLAFDKAGDRMFSASEDQYYLAPGDGARVWSLSRHAYSAAPRPDVRMDKSYKSAMLTADGKAVLTLTDGGTVAVWPSSPQDRAVPSKTLFVDPEIISIVGGPGDNSVVATLPGSRIAVLKRSNTGSLQQTELKCGDGQEGVQSELESSGRYFLMARPSSGVCLFDLQSGTRMFEHPLRHITPGQNEYVDVAISRNASVVAAAAADELLVWTGSGTQRTLKQYDGFTDLISKIAISPDGRYVAVGTVAARVYFVDVQAGVRREVSVPVKDIGDIERHVRAIAFSTDNRSFAVGGRERGIRLWQLDEKGLPRGNAVRTFEGHDHYVLALKFSPDGQWLLSGGLDSKINLWPVHAGQEVAYKTWRIPSDWTIGIAFWPQLSGMTVIGTGGNYETVTYWDLGIDKLISAAERTAGRSFTRRERDQYFLGAEQSPPTDFRPDP